MMHDSTRLGEELVRTFNTVKETGQLDLMKENARLRDNLKLAVAAGNTVAHCNTELRQCMVKIKGELRDLKASSDQVPGWLASMIKQKIDEICQQIDEQLIK